MRTALPNTLFECVCTQCDQCRAYIPKEPVYRYAYKCNRYARLLLDDRNNKLIDKIQEASIGEYTYKPCTLRAFYYRANKVIASEGIPFICESCGSTMQIHVHHKDKNISNNNVNNLQVLCKKCHEEMHDTNFF